MQFRRLGSLRAQIIATSLSACLSLACSDEADENESDEAEEHSDAGHERKSNASTSNKNSAAKADAGKPDDEAAKDDEPQAEDDQDEPPAEAEDKGDKQEPSKAPDKDKPASDAGDGGKKPDAEPESLKVSIRFQAKVGKTDFACSHKYAGIGTSNATVTPEDLRLFVHDVQLIAQDGAKVALQLIPREPWQSATLALLDFEDKTGRCADGTEQTNTAITGSVPAGTYTGISFVVGVPEDQNHQDPAKVSEPLKSAASLSAVGIEGFRFARIALAQLSSTADAASSGSIELASTQCSGSVADGTVKCDRANRNLITLEQFDINKNSVVLDVAKLFATVDLTQAQACHSTEPTCEPMFDVLGVDYATGQPKKGQTLFRVE